MTKYLIHANYVGEGLKGLLKEGGSGRVAAIEQLASSMGGSVEAFYYAFGESDAILIVNMPDHASMAAVSMVAGATGAVTVKTTVLMTPQEIDEAAKKTPNYRPPGQ